MREILEGKFMLDEQWRKDHDSWVSDHAVKSYLGWYIEEHGIADISR